MTDLLPCPCGKTPESFGYIAHRTYAHVYGDCDCTWEVSFDLPENPPEYLCDLAEKAWNNAARCPIPEGYVLVPVEKLEAIAALEGQTLLGCADEECDIYPHCDSREHMAHERGANKAFNQVSYLAKAMIEAAPEYGNE